MKRFGFARMALALLLTAVLLMANVASASAEQALNASGKLTLEEAQDIMARNGGDLDLRGTDYTQLPENLCVEGTLDLSGTGITALPGGLRVGGNLIICETPIQTLPEDLEVGGFLDLRDTSITEIPEGLTQETVIVGFDIVLEPSQEVVDGEAVFQRELPKYHEEIPGEEDVSLTQLQPGDVIRLGAYPQGADGEVQPIEWQVLEVVNGRALVLSRYVLDFMPYHSEATAVYWDNSRIRRWLREDFMPAAFSEADLAHICQPEGEDDPDGEMLWQMYDLEDATEYINDAVFFLSYADIERLFPDDDDDHLFCPGASTAMTAWAEANHPDVDVMDGNVCWWLRTSFSDNPFAMIVSPVDSMGASMVEPGNLQGVRPAMWVVTE